MRHFVVGLLAAGVVAAAGGCGAPGIASEPLATCGDLPPRITPEAPLQARVAAPDSAPSGSRVAVRIRLTSSQTVRVPKRGPVLIARDGRVVGKYEGAVVPVGATVTVKPGNPVRLRRDVRLLGCATAETIDPTHPNASRPLLPAGDYMLAVVIPKKLGGPPRIAPPEPIHITRPANG